MKMKKIVTVLVLLLTVLTLCISAVSPACAIITKNGSISLNVHDAFTGVPLANATFRLYFFAAAYESGTGVGYDYVIPYDDCKMDINNLQDSYLPVHLTHFAQVHALPFDEKTSDKDGHIVFENLEPGVYLIVPARSVENYYMPSPFVINIPLYDNENKNWVYDVNATPKMRIYSDEAHMTTYISAKKIWENTAEHPDSITVSLMCDFKITQTVELNAENNWAYRWDDLSAKHTWSIVETDVPDGYTVSYEASSNTVVITNRKNDEVPDTTVPDSGGETTTAQAETTTVPQGETTTKPEELIDTGQLNWPVPVLSVAGLLLFSLGWAMLNLGKKESV